MYDEEVEMVDVTFKLRPERALALAQMCKRIGHNDCRNISKNDEEAYEMRYAIGDLREALSISGYSPR